MEIEGDDGSKILLKPGLTRVFGRGLGFSSDDRAVSRRHVAFQLQPNRDEIKVHFEVIGVNPIWVHRGRNGGVKTFRKSKEGEMRSGDMFCVSAKNPIWFTLKRIELEGEEVEGNGVKRKSGLESELAESLQSSSGMRGEEFVLDSVDISSIEPVKEFGFVVMGHEFDGYPKKAVRDIKHWDWFLEEPGGRSDNDEDFEKERKRGRRRKRKKGEEEYDDEEWTGESEDEKAATAKPTRNQRTKYLTRSKDTDKLRKDAKNTQKKSNSIQRKGTDADEEEYMEDEDEEDETLGGFIVDEEDAEEEEEADDEEEEEEFVEDEYDEELDE